MPFIELPERHALSMFYVQNPQVDDEGTFMQDLRPIDIYKPNLVLLHTGGGNLRLSFAAQFSDPQLAASYNLIALDGRCSGQTVGGEVATYTLEESADDIIAALDTLELGSYAVLGESLKGAHQAAWTAVKRGQSVWALCLVSPCTFVWPSNMVNALLQEWLPAACVNKDGHGDRSGTIPASLLEVINDFYFSPGLSRDPVRHAIVREEYHRRYGTFTGDSSHDLRRMLGWFARTQFPKDLLAKIDFPTLLIQGGADVLTSPPEAAEQWSRALASVPKGAELATIPGAPHFLMYTDATPAKQASTRRQAPESAS